MVPVFLDESLALLSRTPAVLEALLRDLPEAWVSATDGADTWSPYDVVGHLIHAENAAGARWRGGQGNVHSRLLIGLVSPFGACSSIARYLVVITHKYPSCPIRDEPVCTSLTRHEML